MLKAVRAARKFSNIRPCRSTFPPILVCWHAYAHRHKNLHRLPSSCKPDLVMLDVSVSHRPYPERVPSTVSSCSPTFACSTLRQHPVTVDTLQALQTATGLPQPHRQVPPCPTTHASTLEINCLIEPNGRLLFEHELFKGLWRLILQGKRSNRQGRVPATDSVLVSVCCLLDGIAKRSAPGTILVQSSWVQTSGKETGKRNRLDL